MKENYNFEYWKENLKRLQLSVIRGTSYRYLWHEELELMLVLSGDVEYFAGEKLYHLQKGDILFFNQNCGHSIISKGSGNRTISLKLHPQVLLEWGVSILMNRKCFCVTSEKIFSEMNLQLLREYIAQIYFYLKEEKSVFDKAAESLSILVFIEILHKYGLIKQVEGNGTKIINKNERIDVINSYIMQHLTENITLKDIAEVAGYNKTYLSGQFKQWMGFNLSEYVKQMRIQRAIIMLEEQRFSLTEIALESGFSDYNTFSVCMQQYCGRKPQEYKNSIKNDKNETEIQRHFARYPDDYIENSFWSLKRGRIYEEDWMNKKVMEITNHAKAILQIVQHGNVSD